MKNKKGFTLAEVLITLGIIGVVAALTIPTLIHNQQKAALKSQFAKANALVNTAVNQLVYEKGITNLQNEYCYQNDASCKTGEYTGMDSCAKLVTDLAPYTKYNDVRLVTDNNKNPLEQRNGLCNIDGKVCAKSGNGPEGQPPYFPSIYLQDGSIINVYPPSNAWPEIVFDINGNKGPNKMGYDIFWWRLQGIKAVPIAWSYGDGEDCQLSGGSYSGVTCGQYAVLDKCPWDSTKGYWECLP